MDSRDLKLMEQKKAMEMFKAIRKITESGCNAEIKCVKGKYTVMKVRKDIQTEFTATI